MFNYNVDYFLLTASPNIKLSPKAKQFAACSAMASKTAAGRANKAKDNLNLMSLLFRLE